MTCSLGQPLPWRFPVQKVTANPKPARFSPSLGFRQGRTPSLAIGALPGLVPLCL